MKIYLLKSIQIFVFIIAFFAVGVSVAHADGYEFQSKFGSDVSSDGKFNNPYGVSTDSQGNIFVTDSYNYRIQKFDSSGNYITKWGTQGTGDGQFSYPSDISTDSDSNIFVTDSYNHRIQKFDSSGNYITKWGTQGTGDGQFSYPYGVSTDSNGNVYVVDSYNHRIQKFDSSGNFILKWGTEGSADGQFSYPNDISSDSNGNVYVADYGNNRIQKFDSSGNYITKWGTEGSADGQFSYPYGVSTDSNGNVYVVDTFNHRIQKFDSNGVYVSQFGSYGFGNGQFNSPATITLDSNGNLYVADYGNHRIQKFIYITEGCTNSRATNFNSVANRDNGLCTFPPDTGGIVGTGPSSVSPSSLPGYVKPRPQIVYPDGRVVYLDEPTNETLAKATTITTTNTINITLPIITTSIKPQTKGVVVKSLQQILNSLGFTLTQTGPGSPGNETETYGTLTRQAVQRFQCEKNIVCSGTPSTTGYGNVGPRTREAINNAMKR